MHKAVIITALAILVLHRIYGRPQGWTHWILAALFLGSFGLAAWHVGVEFGIFEGPKTCAGGGAGTMPAIDPNDPLSFLDGDSIKPPACSEAVWHFLGLSMAAWNAVISLIAALWMAISKGTTSDKGKTAP